MAKLDRQTLFSQLADILRREIERDGYPGCKIDSERVLAARFGVSPVTVREALGILREEGLIERRHGSGSYVLERRRPRIGVVLDFDIADAGLSYFYRSATQAARRQLIANGFDAPLYAGLRSVTDGESCVTCREFVADVQAGRLAGIVAIAALPDAAWVESARRQSIPAVGSPLAFDYGVKLDHAALVRDGARQLLDAGRTRLALLGWGEGIGRPDADAGAAVFRETLAKAGVVARDAWMRDSLHPTLPGAGWEEFREIWSAFPDKPDGLLITDDMLFNDVKTAILELGIAVPESLMIATHANRGSQYHYPFPVTTLEVDPEEYGHILADQAAVLTRGETLPENFPVLKHQIVEPDDHFILHRPCGNRILNSLSDQPDTSDTSHIKECIIV